MKRTLTTSIVFCLAFLLASCQTSQSDITSQPSDLANESVSNETGSAYVSQDVRYSDDIVVNEFITKFNNYSQYTIGDIEKGNIRTKYFGFVNDCYIEMINANDAAAAAFCVTINGGQEASDTDKMFAVFVEAVNTLDSTLSSEQIEKTIDDFRSNNVLVDNYSLGDNIVITYVPSKDL